MDKRFATIWDGEEFRDVPLKEANRLVKEDKAQNVSDHLVSATELKFRKEIKGYMTREIRAEPTVSPVLHIPPIPSVVKKPTTDTKPAPPDISAEDWMKYRKAASADLGKPWNKTTKVDTITYMEKHLGLEKT